MDAGRGEGTIPKQYELGLQDYWRILKRRRWIILFVSLTVFAVMFLFYQTQTPIYRASTVMEMTKPLSFEEMKSFGFTRKSDLLANAAKDIQSNDCLRAALADLGEVTDSTPTAEVNQLVSALRVNLSVKVDEKNSSILISLTGPRREHLVERVNAVAAAYKRLAVLKSQESDNALILFLEGKIAQYSERLMKAEAAMIEFRRDHLAVGDYSNNGGVAASLNRRSDIRFQIAQLEEEIGSLRNRLLGGAIDLKNSPELYALAQQRDQLVSKRDELLDVYTPEHPAVARIDAQILSLDERLNARIDAYKNAQAAELLSMIRQREKQIAELHQQIALIEVALQGLPAMQVEEANLNMEYALSRRLYEMFWQRLEDQKIVRQQKTGVIDFREQAQNAKQIYPNEKTQYSIAITIAILVGLSSGFIWEMLDTSIKTIEEVESYVGVPVLGVVPNAVISTTQHEEKEEEVFPGKVKANSPGSIIHFEPRDPVSEAFRALAATLEFTFFNEGHRVLLIGSATPQEGKTTAVSSIGIALANAGRKTLLIDANLRHPGITKTYNLSGHTGLSEALEGLVPWRTCAYMTGVDNLEIIPTGALPGKPVELLKTSLSGLLREISLVYDSVLIDSPPVLPVADATIISSLAGGTLLVYSQGHAPRDVLLRAKAKFETAKGRVIGLLLNKVRPEGELGQNYYYYYYYYYPKHPRVSNE